MLSLLFKQTQHIWEWLFNPLTAVGGWLTSDLHRKLFSLFNPPNRRWEDSRRKAKWTKLSLGYEVSCLATRRESVGFPDKLNTLCAPTAQLETGDLPLIVALETESGAEEPELVFGLGGQTPTWSVSDFDE